MSKSLNLSQGSAYHGNIVWIDMVKVLPQTSLQYFQIKNMVARSHGRGLPWKALQYKSSTIQWKRKYCAIKKEDVYGKNRRDDSPATESYRGGTKIEREHPKNLKLVLRAKYDNSILVKIFPKLFKILFHYTKSPAGIHGPLNLARGIDSTDEPVQ